MFERLAPFIRDYIYRKNWDELRDIQIAACHVIFDTDDNLLLSSGTASGKTEAAFLPVLTKLFDNPSKSVGALYVSPLKALINDQFERIDELISESGIKVTKWHGDASRSKKTALIKNPEGIIQTTPESLEAMLMRRKTDAMCLFSDLRYIIIDEVHYFMTEDRGIQLLCILERLQRLTGVYPVRIGLSATLGDYKSAEKWLNTGTKRSCQTPKYSSEKRHFKLSMQYFPVKYESVNAEDKKLLKNYYEYLYCATFSKRCIIFSNSKAEVEDNIAHLKKIAEDKKTDDIYLVHHGNISAGFREYAEETMKSSEKPMVTGATVTLELGIDLGELERIIQTGPSPSVSSFVQRLGRSGRRGKPSEMLFVFKEDIKAENEFYKAVNWSFLMCIAVIQLYLDEKWIEPIIEKKLPYGILYHQTMSFLASAGEVSPAYLAQNMLTLEIFKNISQNDYKKLLNYMVENKALEIRENNTLAIGESGEYSINSFDFYSVFETPVEYSVKSGSEEIGRVEKQFPKGERFALAGRSWEVTEIDKAVIYVKELKGISVNKWTSEGGYIIHSKIPKKMKELLLSDKALGYMSDKAGDRFSEIKNIARMAGILKNTIVQVNSNAYAIFLWIGTKELTTLSYALSYCGIENQPYFANGIPVCILTKNSSKKEIQAALDKIKNEKPDKHEFPIPKNAVMHGKFNSLIPPELLLKQYTEDFLNTDNLYMEVL